MNGTESCFLWIVLRETCSKGLLQLPVCLLDARVRKGVGALVNISKHIALSLKPTS